MWDHVPQRAEYSRRAFIVVLEVSSGNHENTMGCGASAPKSQQYAASGGEDPSPMTRQQGPTHWFAPSTVDSRGTVLPPDAIGFYSNAGAKTSGEDTEPKVKVNQDRGVVCYPFVNDPNCMFMAVCDGHGETGEDIAQFTADGLLERCGRVWK